MKMTREQLEALVILQEIQTAMARQKLKSDYAIVNTKSFEDSGG